MKTILVTGAAGYIGRHVVKAALDRGYQVIASDFQYKGVDERARFCDVPLFSGAKDIYRQMGEPDVLIHLAWRDGFIHNSPAHMKDLSNHVVFLNNMAKGGLPAMTVMGTMHEVGYWEGAIEADTPCDPQSQYGIAKNALREASEWLAAQNKATLQWLRGYYIVGNSQYGSSIFSKITAAANEGKTEFPFTMGQNQYDFIDYGDFCLQVASAVEQDAVNGIINICSGKPEKLADRVERFIQENHYAIALKYGAFPDRPYDSKAVWGNDAKIQAILQARNA